MQVTDVKIRKTFAEGPMLAVASVTLSDVFVIHDVKVISASDRLFIVMPSRKNADGTYHEFRFYTNGNFMLE
ncbi:MAG: SpoVG family protein, partial [Clostridia bacterium]|nr:SpoVG family protein [Clostridia bacterium]